MLSVGDGVADDILQEHLQDTSGLFIDETAYPLDSSSSCQSSYSRLGDALNVVPQDLTMPLGAALSKALATLTSPRHDGYEVDCSMIRFGPLNVVPQDLTMPLGA